MHVKKPLANSDGFQILLHERAMGCYYWAMVGIAGYVPGHL